jgi:hypothetical protein
MSPKASAKTSTSIVVDARCQYVAASGRRCRTHSSRDTSRASGYSAFCLPHAQMEQQFLDASSVAQDLIGPLSDFRTNMSVNRVLGKLLKLVAQNRLPFRNANTLAYICQLLLTSNPGVRYETNLTGGEEYEIKIIDHTMDRMYGTSTSKVEYEEEDDEEEGKEAKAETVQQPMQTKAAPLNSFEDLVAAGVRLLDGK